jgi:hypothetical protein
VVARVVVFANGRPMAARSISVTSVICRALSATWPKKRIGVLNASIAFRSCVSKEVPPAVALGNTADGIGDVSGLAPAPGDAEICRGSDAPFLVKALWLNHNHNRKQHRGKLSQIRFWERVMVKVD